jgi:ELWxxDGT repeat protein
MRTFATFCSAVIFTSAVAVMPAGVASATTTGPNSTEPVLVKDVNTSGGVAFSGSLAGPWEDFKVVRGYSLEHGIELWRTDGTAAGTSLVKDINPGQAGSSSGSYVEFNNLVFFVADDGEHGYEMPTSPATFSTN